MEVEFLPLARFAFDRWFWWLAMAFQSRKVAFFLFSNSYSWFLNFGSKYRQTIRQKSNNCWFNFLRDMLSKCAKVQVVKNFNGVYSSLFRTKASGGHSKGLSKQCKSSDFLQELRISGPEMRSSCRKSLDLHWSVVGLARPRVCKCLPPQIPVSQSPF